MTNSKVYISTISISDELNDQMKLRPWKCIFDIKKKQKQTCNDVNCLRLNMEIIQLPFPMRFLVGAPLPSKINAKNPETGALMHETVKRTAKNWNEMKRLRRL